MQRAKNDPQKVPWLKLVRVPGGGPFGCQNATKKGVRHNQRPWAAPGAQRAPRGAKEAKKGGKKGPDEGQKIGFGSFRLKIVKSNKNTLFAMFEPHNRSRKTSISGDLWLPKSVPKPRGDRCVPK